MQQNKSPGLAGICAEFCQTFWPIFGTFFVDVFKSSYTNGISPISKNFSDDLRHKTEDKDNINNYGPISLTNVDFRIIANRLQKVIKIKFIFKTLEAFNIADFVNN